ncbi:uncharacterized protein [Nicotiana tomentosiformis]|uniref:uncharacterized protein n=1 Tax=Nicotiana tomentosiformis TaxID=4098 RepID=UPI00388CEA92
MVQLSSNYNTIGEVSGIMKLIDMQTSPAIVEYESIIITEHTPNVIEVGQVYQDKQIIVNAMKHYCVMNKLQFRVKISSARSTSIKGWEHCRPVVVVDDTFLKSAYRGIMLTTSTMDAVEGQPPVPPARDARGRGRGRGTARIVVGTVPTDPPVVPDQDQVPVVDAPAQAPPVPIMIPGLHEAFAQILTACTGLAQAVSISMAATTSQATGGTQTLVTRTPEQVIQGLQTLELPPAQLVIVAQDYVVPAMPEDDQRRLERFGRLQPPYFSGTYIEDAQDFLDRCQRILRTAGILETCGVLFTTFQFSGAALRRWETYNRCRPVGATPLTWQQFSVVFLEKFVPRSYREELHRQFERLHQGDMSVTQYEIRFSELARHAIWLVPTDRERIMRERVSGATFDEVVDIARQIKMVSSQERVEQEAKRPRGQGAFSGAPFGEISDDTKRKHFSILEEANSDSSPNYSSNDYSVEEDINIAYKSVYSQSGSECHYTETYCTCGNTPASIRVLTDSSKEALYDVIQHINDEESRNCYLLELKNLILNHRNDKPKSKPAIVPFNMKQIMSCFDKPSEPSISDLGHEISELKGEIRDIKSILGKVELDVLTEHVLKQASTYEHKSEEEELPENDYHPENDVDNPINLSLTQNKTSTSNAPGITVITSIKPQSYHIPIKIVISKNFVINKITLLDSGADRNCIIKCIVPTQYPIPNKRDLLRRTYKANVYSKFDMKSGFWQIQVAKKDRYKIAFNIPFGQYE